MPRDLTVITLALFTWGLGEGMFWYLHPVYLQTFGADPVQIGAVFSMVGMAMALAQIPAGAISDRIGARPVLRSAWLVGLLSAVLMALANSLPVFVAGMLLYGVTSYVSAPLSSYQSQARGHWSVERALTVPGAVYNMGTFIGALTGGWVGDSFGLQNVYRAAGVFFVISTMIVFQARKQTVEASIDTHAGQAPSLRANPRFFALLGLIVLSLFALYLPQPLTSIYLTNQHGFNVQQIGAIGAVAFLSNAVIVLLLGSLLPARIGMIVGQVMVAVFVLLMWRGERAWLFFLGYFFLGGFRLYRYMAIARARSTVRASQVGLAFGFIETANAVALILAPLAAGVLYDRSPQSVYAVSLAAIAFVLVLTSIQAAFKPRSAEPPAQAANPSQIDSD